MIKEKYHLTLYHSKDDEEATDVEETRYPYYDDNLDLAGYTSELRDMNGRFIAVVDFNADGSEGRLRECPHCLEYEIHNKLGRKIKKKGEAPAPDDDQFLSCYECGNTFGIHETFVDSKIKDSIQTTDNPFDSNQTTVLGIDSRATQRRKGKKPRSKRLKIEEHEDSEIQREIHRHGEQNVHILQ